MNGFLENLKNTLSGNGNLSFLEFRYRLTIVRSLKILTGLFTFIVIDWWGFSVSYYLHFREAFYKRLDVATGMMALLFIFPSILQDIG